MRAEALAALGLVPVAVAVAAGIGARARRRGRIRRRLERMAAANPTARPTASRASDWLGAIESRWSPQGRRRARLDRAVPDVVERCLARMLVGQSLESALAAAARETPGDRRLREDLLALLQALRLGLSPRDALARWAARCACAPLERLVAATRGAGDDRRQLGAAWLAWAIAERGEQARRLRVEAGVRATWMLVLAALAPLLAVAWGAR